MKTPAPSAPKKDWLLIGSRSATVSGIDSPPGPISGPLEPALAKGSLLRDYGDESAWSRRIEAKAWCDPSIADIPEDDG